MQDTEYKVFDECGNLIAPSIELGPSARERFEEAGFRVLRDDEYFLVYGFGNEEKLSLTKRVIFEKDLKQFRYIDFFGSLVNMETLELINYQCKELGWL